MRDGSGRAPVLVGWIRHFHNPPTELRKTSFRLSQVVLSEIRGKRSRWRGAHKRTSAANC